jgi:FkbM family methyltransferase
MRNQLRWLLITVRVFSNWFEIYSRRFLTGRSGNWELALRGGPVLEVADKNTALPIIVEVWDERVYGELPLKKDAHACVVDVGANIGSFTTLVLHSFPEAHVVSIEPEPHNAALLRRNIERNSFSKRCRVIESALGSHIGEVTLYRTGENTGTNSLYTQTKDSVRVPCTTLDALFESATIEHCAILKVDCEGAEYDIFESASKTTLAKIDHVILEWHEITGKSVANVRELLESNGFEISESKTHRLLFAKR